MMARMSATDSRVIPDYPLESRIGSKHLLDAISTNSFPASEHIHLYSNSKIEEIEGGFTDGGLYQLCRQKSIAVYV
jgi:hypothetical protein